MSSRAPGLNPGSQHSKAPTTSVAPHGSAVGTTIIVTTGALAACIPLLVHGNLPLGSDVYSTTHYLRAFMNAFAEGDLYPRWTDTTNQGLGAPSFVLLTPLTYYIAGCASWITGSIISGLKLHLLVVSALAAVSFYQLARDWIGPGVPSAVGAGIYLLLPYHVLDMYQRFALSETTAFVFFPLILLFARRMIQSGGGWSLAGLSLSYAGLVYTHIVSALIFSLLLGIWLVSETRLQLRALLRSALALLCGLALAAPALVPAVMEKSAANVAWLREMPNGDYRLNFIFNDEVLPGLGIRDPVKPPVLRSAHSQLALSGVAAALALAWTPASRRRRRRDIVVLACGCGLAYLVQLQVSTPVWVLVPELASIQFPWRFQTMMVLAAAMLSGFAMEAGWGQTTTTARRGFLHPGAILLGVTLLGNLVLAWQNTTLKPFQYDESVSHQPFVVNWIEPAFTPVQFEGYRTFKQARLDMPLASFIEGAGEVAVEAWLPSVRRIKVTSADGGRVALRSFWFPGWAGTLDGHPLELKPLAHTGTLSFTAPAGAHEVRLWFGQTPVRRAGVVIGLAGVLLTVVTAVWSFRRPGRASIAED